MSSQVAGTLRLGRENRRLLAVAAAVLDPRAFVRWVEAGRAGAIEAARLLAASTDERTARLRDSLARPAGTALPLADVDLSTGLDVFLAGDLAGPDLGAALAGAPVPASDESIAGAVAEVLASDLTVIETAIGAALAEEGFAAEASHDADAVIVVGRRGDHHARVTVDRERHVTVDLDGPGFASTAACQAARDTLVARLAEFGLAVDDVRTRSRGELSAAVVEAVTASLPGFEIRSIVEGDELQILALPARDVDAGGAS